LGESPRNILRENLFREKKEKAILSVVEEPQPSKPTQEITLEETPIVEVSPTPTTAAAFVEVPNDEELYSKLYYPISEVAKMFQVNISLIRLLGEGIRHLKAKKKPKR